MLETGLEPANSLLTRQVLYQLSYSSIYAGTAYLQVDMANCPRPGYPAIVVAGADPALSHL